MAPTTAAVVLALCGPAHGQSTFVAPELSCPPAPAISQTDVACTPASYAATLASDSPSLHWRLGEPSGSVAADASGHGRNGTYMGSRTQGDPGAFPGPDAAVRLHGNNGRVISDYNPFSNESQLTIEGWAKRATDTTPDALFGGTGSNPPRLMILGGSNDVRFRPIPSSGAEQPWEDAWPATGEWVHWAIVLHRPTHSAELYINGASQGVRTVAQEYHETPGSLQAGATGSTNNPFDGWLDEVAVYETALSAGRIRAQ